jgi:hypothetical protein
LVWDNEVGAQNPQERVAHAQSCGDEENTLGERRTWDRQVIRGRPGAPVARRCAEKAPQAVE